MSEEIRRSSLHIHGIRELPPDVDEDLGRLFCEMRRVVGGTTKEIADRLRAEPTTIGALEEGAIRALPDWQETERVVSDYAALLSLDATPILDRLRSQLYPQGPAPAVAQAPSGEDADASSADAVLTVPPLASARGSAANGSAEDGEVEATEASLGVSDEGETGLIVQTDDADDSDRSERSASALTRRRIAIGAAVIGACVLALVGWSLLSGGSMESGGQVAGVNDQVADDGRGSDDPRARKADKLPVRGQGSSR